VDNSPIRGGFEASNPLKNLVLLAKQPHISGKVDNQKPSHPHHRASPVVDAEKSQRFGNSFLGRARYPQSAAIIAALYLPELVSS
jgi:hypothetical protein